MADTPADLDATDVLLANKYGGRLEGADQAASESGRRATFGPAAGNSIPEEWVEELLWRLHAADPQGFGIILMDLYREQRLGDVELRVTRGRKRGE